MSVMMTVFGVFFYPLSKHLYYINSIKKLFLVRTRDEDIFQNSKNKNSSEADLKISKYLDESNYPCKYEEDVLEELKMHRLVKLSFKDNTLLFLHNNIPCFKYCPWKKRAKLQKLFM